VKREAGVENGGTRPGGVIFGGGGGWWRDQEPGWTGRAAGRRQNGSGAVEIDDFSDLAAGRARVPRRLAAWRRPQSARAREAAEIFGAAIEQIASRSLVMGAARERGGSRLATRRKGKHI